MPESVIMSTQKPWLDLHPDEAAYTIDVSGTGVDFSNDELRRDPKFEECVKKQLDESNRYFPYLDEQLCDLQAKIEELEEQEKEEPSVEDLYKEHDELARQLSEAAAEKDQLEKRSAELKEQIRDTEDRFNYMNQTAASQNMCGENPLKKVDGDFKMLIEHVLFEVEKANEIRRKLGMKPFTGIDRDTMLYLCSSMENLEALKRVLGQIQRFYASAVPAD